MKKRLMAAAVLLAVFVVVAAAGFAASSGSGLRPIAADSACPAAGCASGECHGFGAVPEPDGAHAWHSTEAQLASGQTIS